MRKVGRASRAKRFDDDDDSVIAREQDRARMAETDVDVILLPDGADWKGVKSNLVPYPPADLST